jgi:hypothetical protein
MLNVTQRAKIRLKELLERATPDDPSVGLRLGKTASGALGVFSDRGRADDEIVEHEGEWLCCWSGRRSRPAWRTGRLTMMNAGLIGVSWLRNVVGFRRDSKPSDPMLTGIVSLLIVQLLTGFAEAQGSARPAMVDSVERMGLFVVLGFFVLLILLVIGVGVMFFDLAGRREEDAAWLQMKIGHELLRDRRLAKLQIRPVVHAPVGTGVTVRVELTGEVPSHAARSAAVDIVKDAAVKLRREIDIDDRLAIDGRAA